MEMMMRNVFPLTAATTLPREDGCQMQGSEIALSDTIKAILEILMAAEVVSVDTVEMMLLAERAKYLPWRTPDAEAMIDRILTFLRDPARREWRERLRSALQASIRQPGTVDVAPH
jgi:hypothetical protein